MTHRLSHRLTPDALTVPARPTTARSYEDVFMLSYLADQLIAEADICGDIRSGPWLFLARLGEGIPVANQKIENHLWTAMIDIDFDARLPLRPSQANSGVVTPQPNSACVHQKDSGAVERVAAFDGAGIAIFLDRKREANDDLIWSLTCLLEPRHPDDTGPMVWYGRPPKPLVAEGVS